jgi:excisionase family DNA binding protein
MATKVCGLRASSDDQLLTVSEVARLFNVHEGTVRRWIRTGKVSHIRLTSGTIRLRRGDLLRPHSIQVEATP